MISWTKEPGKPCSVHPHEEIVEKDSPAVGNETLVIFPSKKQKVVASAKHRGTIMSLIRNYVTTQKWRKVWGPFVQRAIGKKPKADRRTAREVRKCVPLHSKIVNKLTKVFSCFLHVEHLETLSLPHKVPHLAPTLFAIFALFSRCDVIADKAHSNWYVDHE